MEKAADLAQNTFQSGLQQHGHHGRAFIETLAELCRNHPNIVGIGVGLLVEQLLSEEKREHDRRVAQIAAAPPPPPAEPTVDPITGEIVPAEAAPPPPVHEIAPERHHAPLIHPPQIRLHKIRPVHLAFDVFGGLLLLKVGLALGHLFGRKKGRPDGVFAAVARVHLLSASIATYYFASALRAPKVSAWRNAAIALFGTDAIKPILKPRKPIRAAA